MNQIRFANLSSKEENVFNYLSQGMSKNFYFLNTSADRILIVCLLQKTDIKKFEVITHFPQSSYFDHCRTETVITNVSQMQK